MHQQEGKHRMQLNKVPTHQGEKAIQQITGNNQCPLKISYEYKEYQKNRIYERANDINSIEPEHFQKP